MITFFGSSIITDGNIIETTSGYPTTNFPFEGNNIKASEIIETGGSTIVYDKTDGTLSVPYITENGWSKWCRFLYFRSIDTPDYWWSNTGTKTYLGNVTTGTIYTFESKDRYSSDGSSVFEKCYIDLIIYKNNQFYSYSTISFASGVTQDSTTYYNYTTDNNAISIRFGVNNSNNTIYFSNLQTSGSESTKVIISSFRFVTEG